MISTTKYTEQDIYDLYKTVKHFEKETHHGIIITTSNCNFDLLINDKKVLFFRKLRIGQVGNGVYAPINQAILKSGTQQLIIKMYPGNDRNTRLPNTSLGNAHLKIEIVANDFVDGKPTGEYHLCKWEAPLDPPENRIDNIPWFKYPNLPFYKDSVFFEAKVPYKVDGWQNSQILITDNKDELEKLTKEVLEAYSEMRIIFQEKDKDRLAEKIYLKEKRLAQQLYLTKTGIKNRWEKDCLEDFNSLEKKEYSMLPIENFKLVFYGNGRLVGLERIDQKYNSESALMSRYKNKEGKFYRSYYDFLLHRPKRNEKLQTI